MPATKCYETKQAGDICRIPGEPGQEPAPSAADFSNATAFLAAHEPRRQQIAGVLAGERHVPCAAVAGQSGPRAGTERRAGVDRTMLIAMVPAYGGSSALQQFILSNSRIASLCRGDMWQCEGSKFGMHGGDNRLYGMLHNWSMLSDTGKSLEAPFTKIQRLMECLLRPSSSVHPHFLCRTKKTNQIRRLIRDVMPTVPVPATMLDSFVASIAWDAVATWGRIWDLQKPVLLDKSPGLWFHAADVLHDALLRYPGGWPLRKIRPVYALMWKPLCLEGLSHNFNNRFNKNETTAMDAKIKNLERAGGLVRWANRVGARMVVLNYADLLWQPGVVSARLKALLPCVAGVEFDARWTPEPTVDVYPGNHLKANGTAFTYGEAHPPASQCYNLSASACAECAPSSGPDHHWPRMLMHEELMGRYRVAAAFLQTAAEVSLV